MALVDLQSRCMRQRGALNMFMMGEAAQIQHDRELGQNVKAAADVKTAAPAQAAAEMPQLMEEDIVP